MSEEVLREVLRKQLTARGRADAEREYFVASETSGPRCIDCLQSTTRKPPNSKEQYIPLPRLLTAGGSRSRSASGRRRSC